MRDRDVEFLGRWVHERTGNLLRHMGRMPVTARLESLAATLFESVGAEVLPRLMQARRDERCLRIWSGACATGQEVYSLSMLLYDRFPEVRDWHIEILASDLSPSRIQRARRARYTQHEVNRGLPARYLVRYFDKCEGEWVVQQRIQRLIEFKVQNLIEPWPPGHPFDIIVLRHVLIYFDDTLRESITRRAHTRLRPDGFLLLGSAETPRPLDGLFARTAAPVPGCFEPRSMTSRMVQRTGTASSE